MITLDLDKNTLALDLSKTPDLNTLTVLMKWDERKDFEGSLEAGYDPDLWAFVLNSSGKITSREEIVYYKNQHYHNDAIFLPKDNRVGGGDGESMNFTLNKIDPVHSEVHVYVFLFEARKRGQHFGMMENASVTLYNADDGTVIQYYSLNKDFSGANAIHLGTLLRGPDGWLFQPVGIGADVVDANIVVGNYAS
jgi:stress response protein SCP2